MAVVEHQVIGNSQKFTLALGKYAFTPCDYIPKEYLECLINTKISDKDKEIILEYINK
jgi:hypothetical protein